MDINDVKDNKVVFENGKPKIILCEDALTLGGVDVDEAKRLAFQVAIKIIGKNSNISK